MKINYENSSPGSVTITLSGDIGNTNIKELKDIFELRLSSSKTISIIVKELEYFDLTSLQLFVKVAQEAKRIGRKINFDFQFDQESKRLIDQTGITSDLISSNCNN